MEFDIAQYLTELTRYELSESYYLARGVLVSDVTIFMTILFAYVTVAYFVSAKMTKFQAITISFLYSFFALYIASAAYNSSFILSKIGVVMSGVDSSSDSLVLVVLFLVTWIFSIILFIQTHRTRDD